MQELSFQKRRCKMAAASMKCFLFHLIKSRPRKCIIYDLYNEIEKHKHAVLWLNIVVFTSMWSF